MLRTFFSILLNRFFVHHFTFNSWISVQPNRNLDTDQYTIAVKAGILNGSYSRNQFHLCPQRLNDVDQ